MLSHLSQHLCSRWLPAPLGIWGKLPSHGDFLRHRCSVAQARDWQAWVAQAWRVPRAVRDEPGWLTLEPRKAVTELSTVPVAFVMPPGTLAFAPRHSVRGVMLASQDQVGRPCPLIMFQPIAPDWLRRSWSGMPRPLQHDLLYWLARVAARAHAADQSWEALVAAVDGVWQAYAPGWRQLLGAAQSTPSSLQLDTLLRRYCASDAADAARGLHGVQRMPWAHWPAQVLRADQPMSAFWQQDMRGGYVNAAQSLAHLWGVRP